MTKRQTILRIQGVLTEDLLLPRYKGSDNPLAGHCYAASEALYHLLGGKDAGYTPATLSVGPITHWFLRGPSGVVDPTAGQFPFSLDYGKGRGRGFLTRQPSKRAAIIISRVRKP